MEYTAINADGLKQHGLLFDPDSIASVQGSEEEAIELLEWAVTETVLNIHYCPLALKDGAQLRNRFLRRAKNVAQPFERISEEGLLVKGVIKPSPGTSLAETVKIVMKISRIPKDDLWVNERRGQVETTTGLVQRYAKQLKAKGFNVGIVEEYPIASRFQVSFTPL